MELLIRICADGLGLFCGDDWTWGWLDLFIVLFSLWEVGVAPWKSKKNYEELGEKSKTIGGWKWLYEPLIIVPDMLLEHRLELANGLRAVQSATVRTWPECAECKLRTTLWMYCDLQMAMELT